MIDMTLKFKEFKNLVYECLECDYTHIRNLITEEYFRLNIGDYSLIRSDNYLAFVPYTKQVVPLICTHYDTILKDYNLKLVEKNGILSNKNDNILGADDRVGVAIALALSKKIPLIYLFTDLEEVGGIGAKDFCFNNEYLFYRINSYIGLDRCGNKDVAIYEYYSDELNRMFMKHKYEVVTGTFTDVSVIASYIPKPTINISVGFNNEHTNKESLNIQAAYHTYEILCKELPNLINKQFRDMKCITYMYRSNIDTYDLYEEIL